jgi:hypothetical protein
MAMASVARRRNRTGLRDYYNVPAAECIQARKARSGRRDLA